MTSRPHDQQQCTSNTPGLFDSALLAGDVGPSRTGAVQRQLGPGVRKATSWSGYVADAELSPKARIAVRRIMQDDSLASAANWMDEIRDTPEGRSMQRWHFVSNKVCGIGEPPCKSNNCVSGGSSGLARY